jgi:hypothetical protein
VNFSRTAEKNPQDMKRLATRLRVEPPVRDELVALCFRTTERYAQRADAKRTSSDELAHRTDPLLADAKWIQPIAPASARRDSCAAIEPLAMGCRTELIPFYTPFAAQSS